MSSGNKTTVLNNQLNDAVNLYAEMSVNTLLVMTYIAQHEGQSTAEIGKALGLSSMAASRSVRLLSEQEKANKSGLGLVFFQNHPTDLRKRLVHLTTKGKTFVKGLIAH
jgi:DNA-binding MarR family transcriptional regulator